MGEQRYCDVCGFMRPSIKRYGLSRQVQDPTVPPRRNGNLGFKRHQNFGGIDLCDPCWERIGKPKQRPELRGKTGPRATA